MVFRNTRIEFQPATLTGVSERTGKLESFILRYPALRIFRPLLGLLKPDFHSAPDPLTCDLRRVFWWRVTGEPDGISLPVNGLVLDTMFYGTEPVLKRTTSYVNGVPVGKPITKGDPAYKELAELAEVYLLIVRVISRLVTLGQTGRVVGLSMSFKLYEMLLRHPQFSHLKQYWLARHYELRIQYRSAEDKVVVGVRRLLTDGDHLFVNRTGPPFTLPENGDDEGTTARLRHAA